MDGMSPEEFDDYIDSVSMRDRNNALEGMSGMKRLRVKVSREDPDARPESKWPAKLLYAVGWIWLFFTFGWVGHWAVEIAKGELKKS